MTTIFEEKKRCALCNSENQFGFIGSTNTFGSSDLDTRPPEMQRSTMSVWVQRCPVCGYCTFDVSTSRPGSEAVVNSEEYRKQLNSKLYPELANSFLCKSIIDREADDYARSTLALIHAAWVCDDADYPIEAKICRYKAAEILVTAESRGQVIAEQQGVSTLILVDLLRRSGHFDDARKAIAERRKGITVEIILRSLDFQSVLIQKGDTSCHNISEVFGE